MREKLIEFIKKHPGQYTYNQVGEFFGMNGEQVRGYARRSNLTDLFNKKPGIRVDDIIEVESSLEEDEMREPTKAELAAFRAHCETHGLPFENWRAFWHKTNEYSSFFTNKEAMDEFEQARDEFLERIAKSAPQVQKQPVPTKTLAVLANFDVHIGKHCEQIRSANDYTPDKAVGQVLEGQSALYELSKPFEVSDVLLPMGNDVVHVDNNRSTTTSGTQQDTYGSLESQMMLAAEMYIRTITWLAEHHNVWLCHVHSNHDRVAGWSVSQIVAAHFHDHPRVHAAPDSMSQQHRKYFVFGDSLIMFHHGEAKEEKLLGLIKAEANKAMSQTNRIYCYQGHTHHKTVSRRGLSTEQVEKDHSSLTVIKAGNGAVNQLHVETVRSPSPADNWHSEKGFVNMPAIEVFLHNDQAQFCRFTHWF